MEFMYRRLASEDLEHIEETGRQAIKELGCVQIVLTFYKGL
jgi:hypothetical protein